VIWERARPRFARVKIARAQQNHGIVRDRLKSFNAARQLPPALPGRRRESHSVKKTARGRLRSIEVAVRVDPEHPGARAEASDYANRGEAIPR
jgi:hypothetical protein